MLPPSTPATFSDDGKWIATFDSERRSSIWEAATGDPLTPPLFQREVRNGMFLGGGRYL